MYAIIETGGKQFKVKEGDYINVEKLKGDPGDTYTFDKVLGIFDESTTTFGKDVKATVTGKIIAEGKNKKVIIYKYKAKKGFHKKRGHRQPYTCVKIEKIS